MLASKVIVTFISLIAAHAVSVAAVHRNYGHFVRSLSRRDTDETDMDLELSLRDAAFDDFDDDELRTLVVREALRSSRHAVTPEMRSRLAALDSGYGKSSAAGPPWQDASARQFHPSYHHQSYSASG